MVKKFITTEQDQLLAVDKRFNFNGTDHYLEWTNADESKPHGIEFYLVPVTTPTEKRTDGYFKKLGTEVTMQILEQTVIN